MGIVFAGAFGIWRAWDSVFSFTGRPTLQWQVKTPAFPQQCPLLLLPEVDCCFAEEGCCRLRFLRWLVASRKVVVGRFDVGDGEVLAIARLLGVGLEGIGFIHWAHLFDPIFRVA